MNTQSDLVYYYDGSFDGLLCCVFESYEKREIPLDILLSSAAPLLFSGKTIATDQHKAGRVVRSIPPKLGTAALHFVRQAFLTCLPRKELYILRFLRLGYRHGPRVMGMLTDEVVQTLFKAVKQLNNESHLLKGFLRFSVFNNVLVGEITPKNCVLPLLSHHFCARYPEERFLILDKTHGMGLLYQPYQARVIPVVDLELPAADEEEQAYRALWQLFYDTIAIKQRYNPVCRMSHMPKRYWQNMTEFGRPENHISPKLTGGGERLLNASLPGLATPTPSAPGAAGN
jgi:probable DNA metabolism protein